MQSIDDAPAWAGWNAIKTVTPSRGQGNGYNFGKAKRGTTVTTNRKLVEAPVQREHKPEVKTPRKRLPIAERKRKR